MFIDYNIFNRKFIYTGCPFCSVSVVCLFLHASRQLKELINSRCRMYGQEV